MNINKIMFIILCSLSTTSIPMDNKTPQSPPTVIVCIEDRHHNHHIEHQDSDASEDNTKKCCNSSTKLKLALVGFGSSLFAAIVALTIHFTKC